MKTHGISVISLSGITLFNNNRGIRLVRLASWILPSVMNCLELSATTFTISNASDNSFILKMDVSVHTAEQWSDWDEEKLDEMFDGGQTLNLNFPKSSYYNQSTLLFHFFFLLFLWNCFYTDVCAYRFPIQGHFLYSIQTFLCKSFVS